MAAEQQPELSIPSSIGMTHSEVESPPHTGSGVEQSVYRKGWEQVIQSEFEGHIKTGTFSMVDEVPEGRKPVGSKWCFDYKADKKGNITKFKTTVVIRGFTQIRNVDYTHSSSPYPSSAFMKLVLAVAHKRGLSLYNFEVTQAYSPGLTRRRGLHETPGGFGKNSKKTAKLEREIYGLKQSGRKWGHLCVDTLIADGFEQCKADPFIFRKIVDRVVVLIIGVYVDDFLVGGSQEDFKPLLLSQNKKFPTNDLGECTWYDGCGIERNAELGTIKLSLEANVESLMTRFNAHTTSNTPASPGTDLGSRQNDESGGDWPVKQAVGSLLWQLTMTRPGIMNVVRAVAPYAYTPTERLWRTIMKILPYLNGTKSFGITYVRVSDLGLEVFANVDYADEANDRRYVFGIAILWEVLL